MRAFVLPSFDEPPTLRDDLPAPAVGEAELLVRVRRSSVNPVDNGVASGGMQGRAIHEFPVILGRDHAGIVEAVGPEVTRYAVGDEVYGFIRHANPNIHAGTWAELIALPEGESVAPRPDSLDLEAAGCAALAGVTAMACIDALALSEGDTVLIVGANGGVGAFAVQLATQAGAEVLAPGLPEDEQYLRDLGVSEMLDRDGDLAASVRERMPNGVDALADLGSRDASLFERHAAALREGGRASSPVGAAGEGPGRSNVAAFPTYENLERLTRSIDAGGFKVPIQRRYELSEAGDALMDLAGIHKQGKLAIHID
jgi:NADPH:quinone reductase-like Zn-dependent oxidoreductase